MAGTEGTRQVGIKDETRRVGWGKIVRDSLY